MKKKLIPFINRKKSSITKADLYNCFLFLHILVLWGKTFTFTFSLLLKSITSLLSCIIPKLRLLNVFFTITKLDIPPLKGVASKIFFCTLWMGRVFSYSIHMLIRIRRDLFLSAVPPLVMINIFLQRLIVMLYILLWYHCESF